MKTSLRPLLFGLLLATSSTSAFAQDEPAAEAFVMEGATQFVQTTSDAVLAVVNEAALQGATAERQERLRAVLRGFLSYDILAERTLGEHWETRTPEERSEFVALLRDLIETSYSRRLGRGSVEPNSYTVAYTGERERRGRVTVSATVTAQGTDYLLEVKLMPSDAGAWQVYDVITDDVSLEESYAESFANIISEDGWSGLLQRMRDRLEELRAE
jgi:phospholipid transport system substrate-binding protein